MKIICTYSWYIVRIKLEKYELYDLQIYLVHMVQIYLYHLVIYIFSIVTDELIYIFHDFVFF